MPSAASPKTKPLQAETRDAARASSAAGKRSRSRKPGAPPTAPASDQSLPPTDYETDFYAWCFEQAEHLRQRRFRDADLANIIEELEDMGKSRHRALASSYRLLIMHLLKWEYQPEKRARSWLITIGRERDSIDDEEKASRTLRESARQIVEEVYPKARRAAARETFLPRETFPADCPYSLDFLRNDDALPGAPFENGRDRLADDED